MTSQPSSCLAPQNLYYERQLESAEMIEFDTSPRGKFLVIATSEGGGQVKIGPAADEEIVTVQLDADGLVTRMEILPTGDQDGTGAKNRKRQGLAAVLATGGMDVEPAVAGGETMEVEKSRSEVKAHVIYPAKHHVVGSGEMEAVLQSIADEMEERCAELGREGMILEAERLRQRTENDMLLLRAVGTCKVSCFCRVFSGLYTQARFLRHVESLAFDRIWHDCWSCTSDVFYRPSCQCMRSGYTFQTARPLVVVSFCS